MDDNVVRFGGETTLDIDPDRVLEAAIGKVESVVVVGRLKTGEIYAASSMGYSPDILWLMELAKHKLVRFNTEP